MAVPVGLPPLHTVPGSQVRERGWAELTVVLPATNSSEMQQPQQQYCIVHPHSMAFFLCKSHLAYTVKGEVLTIQRTINCLCTVKCESKQSVMCTSLFLEVHEL